MSYTRDPETLEQNRAARITQLEQQKLEVLRLCQRYAGPHVNTATHELAKRVVEILERAQ